MTHEEYGFLCRGKVTDWTHPQFGKFVEGYYVHLPPVNGPEQHLIVCPLSNYGHFDEINPETLGRCAGFPDITGKYIYEHDIIATQPFSTRPFSDRCKKKRLHGVVEYLIHSGTGFYDENAEPEKGPLYWGSQFYVRVYNDEGKYTCCDWSPFFRCKVVGNIFDNPELLEQEVVW